MTNTYKPHLDEQPKADDVRKRQQAVEADREKPSSEEWELEEDLEAPDTLPPKTRAVDRADRQSQKQALQSQSQQ